MSIRDWIACADFTIADILLARALARPAWRRTLSLYAKHLGVEIADIQLGVPHVITAASW